MLIIQIILFIIYLLVYFKFYKSITNKLGLNNIYKYILIIISFFSLISYKILSNTSIIRYILALYIYFTLLVLILYLILYIINKIKDLNLNKKHYITILLISFIITLIGALNAFKIDIKEYNITNNSINNKYNIVLISDLHLGSISLNNRIDNIVDKINKLNPDLVLITGDIFNNKIEDVSNIDNIIEAFKNIKSKYGVISIIGNHEKDDIYTLKEFYNKCNITFLTDEYIKINDEFIVLGRKNSNRSNIDIKTDLPIIVLDHDPKNIDEYNNTFLVLSGHTHNGQIFPFNLIIKPLYKITYGIDNINNTNVIVTSGVSTWGIPIRLFTNNEIVNIHIN